MSREIKFRAKRIDNGQWVYGQYFKTPLTDENSRTLPEVGWFFLSGEPRNCIVQDGVSFVIDVETLCQYTGLTAMDGIEIFEGDIVLLDFGIFGAVYYDEAETSYMVHIHSTGPGLKKEYAVLGLANPETVIGNIYKNPELIGGNPG